jgi:glycerophosphoryl diester phosphodiesterase
MKSLFFLSFFLFSCASVPTPSNIENYSPIVIGHRGASGYLPEHTLESYALAIEQGADYIEPDLVITKDGVLIARHENEISGTTDVAEKYPNRKAKKIVDGISMEGWFAEDFLWKEIETLFAKERLGYRSQKNNGKFRVPSLDQVLDLAKSKGRGVYIETKHPTYFQKLGLALEPKLISSLKKIGWDKADSPVFIQSFEINNLKEIHAQIPTPLVQLLSDPEEIPFDQSLAGKKLTYAEMISNEGLKEISRYAKGIGPHKSYIVNQVGKTSDLVNRAHSNGLIVHPYTFRSDKENLYPRYLGKPQKEYEEFFQLGIDGLFTDFPDHAVEARKKFRELN